MPMVTLLTKEGCNPCNRVKRILREMQADGVPIELREVDFASEAGTALALHYNILYPPAVFVGSQLLAYGKIHERDLQKTLRHA